MEYNTTSMDPELNPPTAPESDPHALRAFTLHDRIWGQNRYVYPVVSRRSHGLSIGINLNPDKICNFDCIYCSVERAGSQPLTPQSVDLAVLRQELAAMLELAATGSIYLFDPFDKIPPTLARINDIAFSGDGEPTTCPNFGQACQIAVELKDHYFPRHSAGVVSNTIPVKIITITNATMLQRPAVRDALAFLDQHDGEIWAKLDAGTEAYYQSIDRSTISLAHILQNIQSAAQIRSIVIQSLFMRVHGASPPTAEIDAYIAHLAAILQARGQIKLVQVYTVARLTTEACATALAAAALAGIADRIQGTLPHLAVEIYP